MRFILSTFSKFILIFIFSFNCYAYEISSSVNYQSYDLDSISNYFLKNYSGYKPEKLKVGFVLNDFSPYDTASSGRNVFYEGLTADYLRVIELIAGIEVALIPYQNRVDAINAIKNREIDLLTTSNSYEESFGLQLSLPYKQDVPSFFTLRDLSENVVINKIGMVNEYLKNEDILNIFPDSKLTLYKTPSEVISALIQGEVDYIILDLYSANYQINREFIGKIKFHDLIEIDSKGFAFSAKKENYQLIEFIDFILSKIDSNLSYRLSNYWNGGGMSVPDRDTLLYARSLAKENFKSSTINVVLSKYSAPISYLDANEIPRGIIIDVLEFFRLLSGIEFKYQFVSNEREQLDVLNSGKADLTVLPKSNLSDNNQVFNRFVAKSTLVTITKMGFNGDFDIVFIPESESLKNSINDLYPDKKIVMSKNYLEAFTDLTKTSSKAISIAPLITSNYYLDKYFRNELMIKDLVTEIKPDVFNFVIDKNNEEVININYELLKLITIEDMNLIANRWQRNAVPVSQTWRDYRYTIYTMMVSVFFILLIIVLSGVFLYRSYKKTLLVKKQLRQQLNLMQIIVDSIPHPIYVRNSNFEYILYNKSYSRFIDKENVNLIGKKTSNSFISHETRQEIHSDHLISINEDLAIFKDRKVFKNNKILYLYHWIQPFKLKNGNSVDGIIGGWIDISDRAELTQQLFDAKELADSANIAKSRFLATMSHEIRTPINAIVGLLDLALKKSKHQEFDFHSISIANEAAQDLLTLIGDILDIAKIEAGRLTLKPKRNNLKNSVNSIYNIYSHLAKQKGISLTLHFDDNIVEDLTFDETRVKQILINIISNAIKFTDKGEVNVSITLIDKSEDIRIIKLVVKDTGIGIPESELENISEAFNQANNHLGRGGTGLGLMIVKSICSLMESSFSIESTENIGTKITIITPFMIAIDHKDDTSKEVSHINMEIKSIDILIVDDYFPNRLLLSEQLKFLGHQVDGVDGGRSALDLIKNKNYQIIITDCNMPDINGYELARKIREYENENNNGPAYIIGYTANAQQEVVNECLQSGMNDCLFKPITIDGLEKVLLDICMENHLYYSLGNEIKQKDELLDINKLVSLINNEEVVLEILREFLIQNEKDINMLTSFVSDGKIKESQSLAHKMKSGSNIIGCISMSEKCAMIEQSQSIEEMISIMNDLVEINSSVTITINEYLKK